MILEVCVGCLADAQTAQSAGADRIELCGALELGGLTPSAGLVEQVIDTVDLPCLVMLRPRAGGFCYSQQEFDCMQLDAARAIDAGAAGIVFGTLTPNATINTTRVQALTSIANEKQTVFHRAFDFVQDKSAALEQLIDLGVTRVLTSGGPATALEGAKALQELIVAANHRIEILPAGSIRAAEFATLASQTGCNQVHIGAAEGEIDPSLADHASASLCDLTRLAKGEYRYVSRTHVSNVREAIDAMS